MPPLSFFYEREYRLLLLGSAFKANLLPLRQDSLVKVFLPVKQASLPGPVNVIDLREFRELVC